MADNEFANRAVALAVSDLEDNLIAASRQYEDAARCGDEITASFALKNYSAAQREYNELTGANQPQQQPGQLSVAQRNFLSRRSAGGDTLDQRRLQVYHQGHVRALNAGLTQDSPQYFAAIEWYADHQGDGRSVPLTETEAARITGCDPQTYAANAQRLRALKRAGHYSD